MRLLFLCITVLFCNLIFSQNNNLTISGIINDSESKTALEYATISILDSKSKNLINGVVSDVDNGAQYEYRFRDETDGLWGTAATDTFNVGTPAAVSISLSLVDIASSAQASLTGLRWAWYDSTDENALGTPTDTGVSETTTAAGLLEIDLPNSALVAGQTGTLIIGDATGRKAAYNLTVA